MSRKGDPKPRERAAPRGHLTWENHRLKRVGKMHARNSSEGRAVDCAPALRSRADMGRRDSRARLAVRGAEPGLWRRPVRARRPTSRPGHGGQAEPGEGGWRGQAWVLVVAAAAMLLLPRAAAAGARAHIRVARSRAAGDNLVVQDSSVQGGKTGDATTAELREALRKGQKHEVSKSTAVHLVPAVISHPSCNFPPCSHPEAGEAARSFVDRLETNIKELQLSLGSIAHLAIHEYGSTKSNAAENQDHLGRLMQQVSRVSGDSDAVVRMQIREMFDHAEEKIQREFDYLSSEYRAVLSKADAVQSLGEGLRGLDGTMAESTATVAKELKDFREYVKQAEKGALDLEKAIISERLSSKHSRNTCLKCEKKFVRGVRRAIIAVLKSAVAFENSMAIIKNFKTPESAVRDVRKGIERLQSELEAQFEQYQTSVKEMPKKMHDAKEGLLKRFGAGSSGEVVSLS